ncbi:response regulator [Rhodocytophaga rosea]|uniref:Response regulator n=1 Tax=Rhodocytophaga rosea TaxID=2704465 RepID=A0A6C0GBT2_9BACT|nr:response regulator [Rhodocytophaga rosea]QHT65304.1 response regulator [Rhodocytophaga rosea]
MEKIKCILLVDDDPTTNFVNETLLEDLQVSEQVLIAYNGKEALKLIQNECESDLCPELILLDINMPVMNGFEFLKAYQRLEFAHKQSVVIVMLTTSLNPGDIKQIDELPLKIKGFLNKPLTEQMVRNLFQKHFHRDLPI